MSSSWWGDVDLSYKFAIVLGAALCITLAAGMLKLCIVNRWTTRMQLKEDMERANIINEKVGLKTGKVLGAGDLFGIRAIEKGFYGGVSQVDLTAPAQWTFKNTGSTSTFSSSRPTTPIGKNVSIAQSVIEDKTTSNSQTPARLRLQPSEAEIHKTAKLSAANVAAQPQPDSQNPLHDPLPPHSSIDSLSYNLDQPHVPKPERAYDPPTAMITDYQTSPLCSQSGNTNNSRNSLGPQSPIPFKRLASPTYSPTRSQPSSPKRPTVGRSLSTDSNTENSSTPLESPSKGDLTSSPRLHAFNIQESWNADVMASYFDSNGNNEASRRLTRTANSVRLPCHDRHHVQTGGGDDDDKDEEKLQRESIRAR